MEPINNSEFVEGIRAQIADFTVGLLKISVSENVEDAIPAGSGALVTVGSIHGILTAAHVLVELPEKGRVGLVRFPMRQPIALRQTIDMDYAEKLVIRADSWTDNGPDLGFLKLSPEDVGTIKARNLFFDLGMKRDSILSGKLPDPPFFDGISGMIAEWTADLTPEREYARVKSFGAMYGIGRVVKEHEASGFDLLDFEVTYGPGVDSPSSFGGMSGGALWRVYCSDNNNSHPIVLDKVIVGVAFYQSEVVQQKRIITCHGPQSIYGRLIDAIRERWPE